MLIALGFRPLKAATVALVANTAPVAFGALRRCRSPTLATVTGLEPAADTPRRDGRTADAAARRSFVPLVLVFIIDGRRGVRADLAAGAVVCGIVFARRAVRDLELRLASS